MGLFKKIFEYTIRKARGQKAPKLPSPTLPGGKGYKIEDPHGTFPKPAKSKLPATNGPTRNGTAQRQREMPLQTVDKSEWQRMNSTNVDRIRWGRDDLLLQVIFKNGDLYQYWDVEPQTYLAFLSTHSPGQFVWYVLRQYGYRYQRLSRGHATSPPANKRFEGEVFAVPESIEAIQRQKGRKAKEGTVPNQGGGEEMWNFGTPTARGHRAPPVP